MVDIPKSLDQLQAELDIAIKRAMIAESREALRKDTAALYEMQFRLERENSQLLYGALQRHAPDALKELQPRLNHSNTELDKVLGEYTRRLQRLTLALAFVRDAETLEECKLTAINALEIGES